MQIVKAKTAGFCFGVERAVSLTEKLLDKGVKVATLGPLIHNPQLVAQLQSRGLVVAHSIDEVPKCYEVVIRSHGVPSAIYSELKHENILYHDATCPYVQKIQQIAQKAGQQDSLLIVCGDKTHPEVISIVGHCNGEVLVCSDYQDLLQNLQLVKAKKNQVLVAQTTFKTKEWEKCVELVKKDCTNAQIFDTICKATWTRQQEAERLAKESDILVVVGGKSSSNTEKLCKVAASYTKVIWVETKNDINPTDFCGARQVAVTAGASTPLSIIEEVVNNMNELNKEEATAQEPATEISEEMSFADMLEASLRPIFRGKVLKGIVTSISPNEITVDIGTKHTGFVPFDEITDDNSAKLDELFKKGEELELMVVQVNDSEGTALLSKKRLEAKEGNSLLLQAVETGEAVEAYIQEAVKGGLVAIVKGTKVFIPASQATLRRGEDYLTLLKQKTNIQILEANGRRVIGSVRAVLGQEAAKARDAFWGAANSGKAYKGTVKSLTNYGAFVDIGGVDGLIHISELSWKRIKHPSDILKIGDVIDCYIKELDEATKKISLGYRKQEDNPWMKLAEVHKVGDILNSKVVSITKFGAFVNVIDGIDGLVHISEISNDRVEKVTDALKIGQDVEVQITELDLDKKRISLSMKALMPEKAPEEAAEVAEIAEVAEVAKVEVAEEATQETAE